MNLIFIILIHGTVYVGRLAYCRLEPFKEIATLPGLVWSVGVCPGQARDYQGIRQ